MHRKENERMNEMSSATSVARIHTSKYLSWLSEPNRSDRTDRILLVYSCGVRLEKSNRFPYLNPHMSLNIHAFQHLPVRANK